MHVTSAVRCASNLPYRSNATSVRVVRAQAAKKLSASYSRGVQMRAPRVGVSNERRSLVVRAEKMDFDQVLAKGAESWEASDKKLAIVGYSAAALVALYVVESLIHLPVLNVLLGFPLELLGMFSAGYIAYEYVKEDGDLVADVASFTNKVTKELPGFKEE